MGENGGSYTFGTFSDNDTELKRLKQQARIVSDQDQEILYRAGLVPGMQVLDVGCGSGCVTQTIATLIGEGSVTGVDSNRLLLQEARRSLAHTSLSNVTFVEADVYDLALPDESYDFVYARLLFQHLRDPKKALQSLRRVLKPGGTVCIMDVDNGWLTFYPEPVLFESFMTRAAAGQQQRGGDRHVGRKLGAYLLHSGFHHINVNILSITSQEIGLQTLLDITTRFKREQISEAEADLAERELQDMYALLDIPGALGFIGIFCATGRK